MKSCGFMAIVKETFKILPRNGKLMSFIAILYLFSYALFYWLNTFSLTPFILDLVFKIISITSASPGTPQFAQLLEKIKKDVGVVFGVETAFMLINSLVSLFFVIAITFISASSYRGDSLSLKDLCLRVVKSWKRPFVTAIYVALLCGGYMSFFILPFLVPILMFFDDHRIACISFLVLLALVAIVFNMYISVAWELSLVVSVLEESRGLEALGKARGLVEGMRLQGFVLNVIITLVALILSQVPNLIGMKQCALKPIIMGLIQVVLMCLVGMFQVMAYTVLYFQCKKNHGEENIKMLGITEYTKIPTREIV